jgi:hypothetical protein
MGEGEAAPFDVPLNKLLKTRPLALAHFIGVSDQVVNEPAPLDHLPVFFRENGSVRL